MSKSYEVEKEVSLEKLTDLFGDLELHPLTAQLLYQRGVKTKEDAKKFLNPSYESDILDPYLIYGVEKAVKRIVEAIKNGEKIAVYSDYDCDGIPGGVLLRTFFDDIGYPVEMYIPHRHNEGYGIHNHAVDILKKKGVTLVITVDLAITNIDEVSYAKSRGVDFIVTDHHLPITRTNADLTQTTQKNAKKSSGHKLVTSNQIVPDAVAVINSKQDACTYHDDMLCGCAVAWKLACAILATLRKETTRYTLHANCKTKKVTKNKQSQEKYQNVLKTISTLKDGYEKWLLDLVGISTIADMVPLVKENRTLAYFGLKVLRQTKRYGLNHIFQAQGIAKEHLVEDDIAFSIAPRINAASRMGDPILAHNMLYEKDNILAQKYVEALETLNSERKQGVKDIVADISFDHEAYKNDVVVVGDLSWGPGMLGLIAQKIIDETGKPTFVYGLGEDNRHETTDNRKTETRTVKGSCRSRGDVHVVELMTRCMEMFPEVITHAGGHEQAGGFSCSLDRVGELSSALNEAIKHVEIKNLGEEKTIVHAHLHMDDVNMVTHNAIQMLAPFGVGNPKPLFSFQNVTPMSVRWFGKKAEHLEVVYQKENGETKAIMFFAPKDLVEKVTKKHTLLAHLEKSVWKGRIELRLRIKEII